MNLDLIKRNSHSYKHYEKLIKLFKGRLLNVQTPRICSKSRPKTMDETNVLELHFFKTKTKTKTKTLEYKIFMWEECRPWHLQEEEGC